MWRAAGFGDFPTMSSTDILLPQASASSGIRRSKLTAFVPITLALLGVSAVLLGGVSAHGPNAQTAATASVDPITTGSIATPADQRRALEMLDN